ncbi:hypothetical protein LOD99_3644 [Oopsacas minuta]|uniref:Uncharacterized protein n=1 Tax=Oopsacas minuta TaxID=111878 RepID=A0AAV7JYN7_9METZ|nr:hypothetical protein LOD99_3644 [Oopsacas minuta]
MLKVFLLISCIVLIQTQITPPNISLSHTAFYTIFDHSVTEPVEGMLWRDDVRGLERRFMSGVIPLIDAPSGYFLVSTGDAGTWIYSEEECNYTVGAPPLLNFFSFLQNSNLTYELEGEIERWSQFVGFYNSMTVNRNDRTRPLTYSFGFSTATATNITIYCWDGNEPDQRVYYLPDTCQGVCEQCTSILYLEAMACPSCAAMNTIAIICLVLSLIVTMF